MSRVDDHFASEVSTHALCPLLDPNSSLSRARLRHRGAHVSFPFPFLVAKILRGSFRVSAGSGMVVQIADQTDDVLGDEPADGSRGVDADDDPTRRVEDESRRLEEPAGWIDERAGGG